MMREKLKTEPEPLREIHRIRERLSKLPREEIEKRLNSIRKRYKQILVSS